MTRVRRINVSQVEGEGANNNDNNEVRPYGELAVYQGDADKLELLMFDGFRTNVKSKVLSKGTFYGGDADSSDGEGYDSIKLVPDEFLRRDGSDQYIIIEPTGGEPGHVHIRAGGTIDQSSADLFLGGEQQNVRVSDTYDRVTITTDLQNTWTFNSSGNLILPGSSNGMIGESEPGVVVFSDLGFAVVAGANNPISNYAVEFTGYIDDGTPSGNPGATLHVTAMIAGTITDGMTVYGNGLPPEGWVLSFGSAVDPIGSGGIGTYVLPGANYLITSQSFNNGVSANNGPKSWIFDINGALVFPNNALVDSADSNIEFRGMSNFNVEAQGVVNINTDVEGDGYSWQFGDDGALDLPTNLKIARLGDYSPADGTMIIQNTNESIHVLSPGDDSRLLLGWSSTNGLKTATIGFNADSDSLEGAKITTGNYSGTVHGWIFGSNGDLTVPGTINASSGTRLTFDGTSGDGYVEINGTQSILIGYNSTAHVVLGNTISDSSRVDILSNKLRIINTDIPSSSTGAAGDMVGMVAFDSSHIYYCTASYSDGVANIWKRVAWSGDTW